MLDMEMVMGRAHAGPVGVNLLIDRHLRGVSKQVWFSVDRPQSRRIPADNQKEHNLCLAEAGVPGRTYFLGLFVLEGG